MFYRKILFDLGFLEHPNHVVMIGDSPYHDIEPAQRVGLKTIQVDRLTKRINRPTATRKGLFKRLRF
jgi:FMN phosphatase YigB (HAD superfamily)